METCSLYTELLSGMEHGLKGLQYGGGGAYGKGINRNDWKDFTEVCIILGPVSVIRLSVQ